jgi:hypothetical protein
LLVSTYSQKSKRRKRGKEVELEGREIEITNIDLELAFNIKISSSHKNVPLRYRS